MELIEQIKEALVDRQDLVEAMGCFIEEKEESIANQRAAINALEGRIAGYEETIGNNGKTLEITREENSNLKSQLAQAVEKYRQVILSAAPELPSELLSGSSIEDLDASLENARKVVQKVKERFEQQAKTVSVPIGAPPRGEADLTSMSAREKIEYGLKAGVRG